MKVKTFVGGWYADAWPTGEYVVVYPDARGYMDTHLGKVHFSTPERKPLYPRLTTVGWLKVAGQYRNNDTLEWRLVGGWRSIPQTAHGVSPVIYDATGKLHLATSAIGSQGYRYVERGTGRLVTGDQTYAPKGQMRLFEWTDLGDGIVIGQGEQGGAVVWDGQKHRLLASGLCRFIRANRVGNDVSVAYWREDGPTAIFWLTMAELRVLPVLASPTPPHVDDPSDDPMTTAQYVDLRDRLSRIEKKVDAAIVALNERPTVPAPTPPQDDDEIPAPAPEHPTIPIESVEWLGKANPLGFKVASHISSVTITRKNDDGSTPYSGDNFSICFPHSKAGQWPVLTNDGGDKYEGNVCIFARIGSRWYGDTAEWLKVNQTCKRLTNRTEKDSWGMGPHTKHAPMATWGPKSGEWFGVMVCTPVRDGVEGPSQERSQIYMTRWI